MTTTTTTNRAGTEPAPTHTEPASAETIVAGIVGALNYDGTGTFTDTDGRTWTVRTEPDECSTLDDDEWYGAIAPVEMYDYNGCRAGRPEGFDGRARKLGASQMREDYWWQPPADVADENLSALRSTLCDILDFGYHGIVVETDDGHMASLFGIEPFPSDDDVAEVIGEHVAEIRHEIRAGAERRAAALSGDLFLAAIR